MDGIMTAQLVLKGFEIAKSLYGPMLREPIKNAVEGNDYEVDDKIFGVIDPIMTGEISIPDEAAAQVLMAIYCPYLRGPLQALTENTGTKVDDVAFQIIDMIFGQNCSN